MRRPRLALPKPHLTTGGLTTRGLATGRLITGRRRRRLGGWGRLATVEASIERPGMPSAVPALLADASQRGVLARGLGRSYGDAAQIEYGTVIDTRGLRDLGPVDASAATVDVGAGVSLGELMRRLAPQGWMLPVLPGTRHVTVGGAIAADIHGKNHHRDATFGRYVESFTLVLPDGETRVLRRAGAGPEDLLDDDRPLFEATLGGMGLTGVVTSARLRLEGLPSGAVRVRKERAGDLGAVMTRMAEGDQDARYAVAWIDLSSPRRRGRGILQFADLVAAEDAPKRPPAYPAAPRRPLPPLPGRGVTRGRAVRAFNPAYYRGQRTGERLRPLAGFLHPLDAAGPMNRLYGRAGLLQYQFVVPHGAEGTLRAIAERLAQGPVTPTLAVLKRLGPASDGMLSFPLPGWTLAVDLPAEDARVFMLLDELDQAVADAGGRVYLAKDARLRPDVLAAMYPRLAEWRAVKQTLDPDGRVRSDLAMRLGLVPPFQTR